MSPFLRKVRTASGATAVQIVEKRGGQRRIVEHLGSAHTQAELVALLQAGQAKLHAGQPELDFTEPDKGGRPVSQTVRVEDQASRLLVAVVRDSWQRLGFDRIDDEAFFQHVLARLVEPTSKLDAVRVLRELGVEAVHLSSMKRALRRCIVNAYRQQIQTACFERVWHERGGDVSLLLYDVTTLYFEAEQEDALRKVGYSKERRVDPQIVVGLLVDRIGFPL